MNSSHASPFKYHYEAYILPKSEHSYFNSNKSTTCVWKNDPGIDKIQIEDRIPPEIWRNSNAGIACWS